MSAFMGVQGAGSTTKPPMSDAEADAMYGAGGWYKGGSTGAYLQKPANQPTQQQMNQDHWSYWGSNPMEAAQKRAAGGQPMSQAEWGAAQDGRNAAAASAPAPAPAPAGAPAFVIGGTQTGTPTGTAPKPTAAPPGGQAAPAGGQGALSQWMSSVPTQGPTNVTVTDDMLTSKQLSKLLSQDSPLFQRARMSAMEMANARGLQNSTMAAQAGEAAVIDAALPIARDDANRYAEAAGTNAGTANTFAREANAFGRQGALSTMQQQLGLSRDLQVISAQTEARLREFDQQQGASLYTGYRNANLGAIDAYNARVAAIQSSDMDADVKQAQIADARRVFQSTTSWLSTMYSNSPGWVKEWSTFSVGTG